MGESEEHGRTEGLNAPNLVAASEHSRVGLGIKGTDNRVEHTTRELRTDLATPAANGSVKAASG